MRSSRRFRPASTRSPAARRPPCPPPVPSAGSPPPERALVLAASLLLGLAPTPAGAVVTPLHGYRATVDGFTSWYGSYGMAGLGTAWCIDHGIRAPDPAFAYRAADLSAVPTRTRTAMAWVLGALRRRHRPCAPRRGDARPARPHGRRATRRAGSTSTGSRSARLAGFGGAEALVLAEARRLKADGLRHAHLRGPLALPRPRRRPRRPTPSHPSSCPWSTRPAAPSPDCRCRSRRAPAARSPPRTVTTGADGTARTFARPVRLPLTVRASALAPRLGLDAWAPTTRPAQRVARPSVAALQASASLGGTTAHHHDRPADHDHDARLADARPPCDRPPPRRSRRRRPRPTPHDHHARPRSAPTTSVPAVAAPTTSTSAPPPETVLSAPPAVPALPRTGVDVVAPRDARGRACSCSAPRRSSCVDEPAPLGDRPSWRAWGDPAAADTTPRPDQRARAGHRALVRRCSPATGSAPSMVVRRGDITAGRRRRPGRAGALGARRRHRPLAARTPSPPGAPPRTSARCSRGSSSCSTAGPARHASRRWCSPRSARPTPASWPIDEVAAARRHRRRALARHPRRSTPPPSAIPAMRVLAAIAELGRDLSPYLDDWLLLVASPHRRGEPARRHLADLGPTGPAPPGRRHRARRPVLVTATRRGRSASSSGSPRRW